MKQCSTCRHWFHLEENFGACRRFPPVLSPNEVDDAGAAIDTPWYYCVTLDVNVCGEWKDRWRLVFPDAGPTV